MSDFLQAHADLFRTIQDAAGQPVFLVGGAVRDAMLNRSTHDLDFVLARNARQLARRVANALHGGFYMLDDARDTARVLYNDSQGQRVILDFATFRDADLEGDLRGRDFTINALALDLSAAQPRLVDPLGGAADLRARVLRACSPSSLSDDPARALRAVRLSLDLQLRILPETGAAIQNAAPLLERISAERLRDEFFRILDGSSVDSALRLMDHFDILPRLLPELPPLKDRDFRHSGPLSAWERTLATLRQLSGLFAVLVGGYNAEKAANIQLSTAVLFLGRFREPYRAHFDALLTPGRSVRALVFLAALYLNVDLDAQVAAGKLTARARALALSQAETQRAVLALRGARRVHPLAQQSDPLSRRAVYRFARAAQSAGPDSVLLALADLLASLGLELPQEGWEAELSASRVLLEGYFEIPEQVIRPPRLLDGKTLMEQFGLTPGPLLGQMLDELQEEQAAGEIKDLAAALSYIEERLRQEKER